MKKRLFVSILILLITILFGAGCSKEIDVDKDIDNPTEKPTPLPYSGVVIETVADIYKDKNVQSERVTQAIYNQPIEIISEETGWYNVKVVDGYNGWIRSKNINKEIRSIDPWDKICRVLVTAKERKVYSRFKGALALKNVVMGTEFYCINKKESWYEVVMPEGGKGWIDNEGIIEISVDKKIPKTSAVDFVMTADKFKGTNYLWGGISSWEGLDCSGLVYICSRVNGVNLKRDAHEQFEYGKEVQKESSNYKIGDLVFFSTNEDLANISHVGIYIGDNEFLHSSQSNGVVTVGKLDNEYFKKRLVGVKRIF